MHPFIRSLSAAAILAASTFGAAPAIAADAAPGAAPAPAAPAPPPAAPQKSVIDLVVCLDTSGSMDGLIESAKVKLWAIVNELAKAKPAPELRVALFQYGNDGIKDEGWVKMEVGFTNDLDEVYGKLNALKTNGGNEYVARVTREAMNTLSWSAEKGALKLIFVAGNEEATQDPKFTVEDVFKEAISKGIQVNTIFCGSPGDSASAGWQSAAKLADGEFSCIDQDNGTVAIVTPMDDKLQALSGKLNTTYLGFGRGAAEKKQAQEDADEMAGNAAPSAGAERAAAKSGALYDTSAWDLVDARERGKLDLSKLKDEELPEEMRKLDSKGREEYIGKKAEERKQIQEEVQKLSKDREAWIKEEGGKKGLTSEKAFDEAIRRTIRTQAAKKGIEIKE